MKGKFLKKGISAVMTLALTLGSTSAFAMVVPPSDAVPANTVLKESDFESSNKLFNKGEIKTLDGGNKVLNITSAEWGELNLGNSSLEKGKDMVISFSAMTGESDGFKLFLRKKGSGDGYLDFAGIEFATGGKIKENDGGNAMDPYNSEICTYEANKWYNIDMVICDAASESYDTYVEYYVNGELKKTVSSKKWSNEDNTMPISRVFVCNTSGETENITNYIDNFKVYYTDTTDKYYAYGNTDKAVTDGTVNVEFSETPLATEESAKLYSPSGNEITLSGQTVSGRFANYSFEKSSLSEMGEYTLVLPQTESVTGKKLANNVVVFDKKDGIKVNEVRYISEYNFDDCADGTAGAKTMLNGINAGYGGTYSLIPSEIVSDGKSGKGLMFSYTHSSSQSYTEGNSLTGFKSSKAFDKAKVSGLNEFITEFDIKAPEQNGKIVSPSFYLYANGKKVGLILIDKNGYLVAAKSVNANGNTVYDWSGVVDESGNYKLEFSEETHSVIKTTAGQWYNVKMGVVPSKNEIRYYVDDKFIGSYVNDKLEGELPSELRIAANDYGDKSGTVAQQTVIDNVRFGWASGDTLKTVENVNGTINNDKNDKNVWSTRDDNVKFVKKDDTKFDSGALIVSADITLEQIKPNVGFRLETKNGGGCPLVSVSVLNESGDIGIDSVAANDPGKYDETKECSNFEKKTGMTVVDKVFKPNIPVNITAYIDANRAYIYVFINKMYAAKLEVSKLQGSTAGSPTKVFDANKDGSISGDELTPGLITVRMLYGAKNQGAYKVENIKLMSVDTKPELLSVRLNSDSDEFTLFNAVNEVQKLVLEYSEEVTDTPSVELKIGDNSILQTAQIDTNDKKKVNVNIDGVLINGQYTLTIDGKNTSFTVDSGKDISIVSPLVVKGNSAEVKALNISNDNKNITLIVAGYNSDGTLADIQYISQLLNPGAEFDKTSTNAAVLTEGKTFADVKAFLWSDFTEMLPYAMAEKNK